ncbi:MAG: hypothetical protein P1P90_03420 [Patescibacteria group bacterium]|nr:hypothetical protein [Patescibacteria group bacterium]
MILTIGNSSTYEFEAYSSVKQALELKGQTAVLFRQDLCLESDYLSFIVTGNGCKYKIVIDGVVYDLDDFDAVWYLKPHLPPELLEYDPAKHRQFVHRQFFALREGLWSLCHDKRWLNDPWLMHEAENKLLQMQVASKVGFDLPDTVITSDPDQVRSFYNSCDRQMIVKILSSSPILGNVIYTNRVTEADIRQIDSVRWAPAIFQELVAKKHELRITVVDEQIFSVKIHSQEDEATALDWRRKPKLNDYTVKMEPTTIPKIIKDKIRHFMRLLGLRYGTIDIIVTPDDRYLFLEINPNGQWYFVQVKTGLQIAHAIADVLSP